VHHRAVSRSCPSLGGLIFAIRAGHFAIAIYIAGPPGPDHGFARQSRALTGGLERAAVFAAVLGGWPRFAAGSGRKGASLVGAGGPIMPGLAAGRRRHACQFRLGARGRLCHPMRCIAML
jgi:hypothetical protein